MDFIINNIDNILRVINLLMIGPFFAGARWLWNWRREVKEQEKTKAEQNKLLREAVLAMMRSRLVQSSKFFTGLGAITSDEKKALTLMGDVYEMWGGNDVGHKANNCIKGLPIDDRILDRAKGIE